MLQKMFSFVIVVYIDEWTFKINIFTLVLHLVFFTITHDSKLSRNKRSTELFMINKLMLKLEFPVIYFFVNLCACIH